jgi:hypothetical protein
VSKYVEKQNITLSIPKEVLGEAKHLAVDRGISFGFSSWKLWRNASNASQECARPPRGSEP